MLKFYGNFVLQVICLGFKFQSDLTIFGPRATNPVPMTIYVEYTEISMVGTPTDIANQSSSQFIFP